MTTESKHHPGDQSIVLVETCTTNRIGNTVLGHEKTFIKRLLRSYDSSREARALQDLALATLADPESTYELMTIDHIES